MVNAKTFLEKRYSDEVGLEDAIHTALLTLKEGFEGQVSGSNIEVSTFTHQHPILISVLVLLWKLNRAVALQSLGGHGR